AIAETSPILKNIPPLIILITPFGILEVFAYGIALSRSGILVYDLVTKKPWREYVVVTLIEIGIVIVILLVGAIIEWQTITQLGGFRNPPNL
ncbi:MAG TPA: hypothetical protein VNB67_07250, partial [Nitrososphaeraceae archaeon]|nr:hypothetical protein [Nitrososphaeraceae archaeon]